MWTPNDQDKALAYRRWLATLCPNCSARKDDWIDPDTGEPHYPPLFEPYIARCPCCEETERLRKSVSPDRATGARISVRPFDPDKPLDESLEEPAMARGAED
jgi:hypothetical protein